MASYILLALGIFLLAVAAYDQCRGITHKPLTIFRAYGESRNNRRYLYRIPVHREQNPQLFSDFMRTHWIYATAITAVGIALYLGSRTQDQPTA